MIFSVEKNMVVLSIVLYRIYIYTICMKFISFFNDIILIQLKNERIFFQAIQKNIQTDYNFL